MATYRACKCGKSVTETKGGEPRKHICNAPDGPGWALLEKPVVPADVDETDHVHTYAPGGRGTENRCACGKPVTDGPVEIPAPGKVTDDPWRMPWTRDTGHRFILRTGESFRADCGHVVQNGAPYRERPEGGYECRGEWALAADAPVPSCMIGRPDTLDRVPAAPTESKPVTERIWADPERDAKGPWVTASFDSTLDCGHAVMQGEEIRADGEGGWECRDTCGVDQEEASYATPEANWNGTGRPRPSASTVKMPEPAPQEDKPRLLDTIREAAQDAQAIAAAGMPGSAGQVMEDAFRDAFTTPTPQGSGPVRGSGIVTNAATASRPDTADPFSSPTHVAPPLGSATDQPETERDQWGRYVIRDPRTGDFKRSRAGKRQGFTRATTFGKTLLDQFGIHQWEMRSVLAGLALRPDLVRAAQGLDVAADKDRLNEIAASAKEAAGGNEAADDGTEFHTVTEWIDTGKMDPEDAPEKFRAEALAYAGKMSTAGLSTEFGWIERVTFTDRGGEDVAGTADRILRERNGQLVVGDVKSGKGIDLAQREIAIQLKVYAMGINQFGLYNKSTQTWEPWTGPPVSEEYGIVMHVPVVRPEGMAAYCDLYRVDLRGVAPFEVDTAMRGAAWTRGWRKEKGFVSPYHAPEPTPRQRTWAEAFSTVATPEEANRLWEAAVAAGMDPQSLSDNVALAREALAKTALK
jgi:hypothetical protein